MRQLPWRLRLGRFVYRSRALRGVLSVYLRLQRRQDGLIIFNSFHGQYSDNPRAVFELLRQVDDRFKCVWLADESSRKALPAHTAVVKPWSVRYLRNLQRASFIVSNVDLPEPYRKQDDVRYVQTWHGTPFKKIGFDIARPAFPDAVQYLRRFSIDVSRWDLLISQNSFSTEIFRHAFGFEGPILECGYPRNDLLLNPEAGDIRDQGRKELGIGGKVAALYAPTWRDDARVENGSMKFDFGFDFRQLASALPDVEILVRAHSNVQFDSDVDFGPNVRNVSDHPDIRELYLIADILITDYSSSMFDFAITDKPIVLFPFDLSEYSEAVRGLCLDIHDIAPGAVVTTVAELISHLQALQLNPFPETTDQYRAFKERFCSFDRGTASSDIVKFLQDGFRSPK